MKIFADIFGQIDCFWPSRYLPQLLPLEVKSLHDIQI